MVTLVKANKKLAPLILDYYTRNREFLAPYESKRDDNFFTLYSIELLLKNAIKNEKNGTGVRFYITLDNKVIGTIALNNIVRGCFHSCFLGYSLDKDYINKGYMTEAVNEVTHYAFEVVKLHRIEANIMPRNIASKRVLEKCGFIEEGYSKNYLYINGVWEDHIHMVKFNPTPIDIS